MLSLMPDCSTFSSLLHTILVPTLPLQETKVLTCKYVSITIFQANSESADKLNDAEFEDPSGSRVSAVFEPKDKGTSPQNVGTFFWYAVVRNPL